MDNQERIDLDYSLVIRHLDEQPYTEIRRKYIEQENDPIVHTTCNGRPMVCRFSHKTPGYQYIYPQMNRQLLYAARYIRAQRERPLTIVDVGANIGDTVLNIGITDAKYICIEGNPDFADLLRENLKDFDYELDEVYITDTGAARGNVAHAADGTARASEEGGDGPVEMTSVDGLFDRKYPDLEHLDIFKVDTDGYDFRVLRSAEKVLTRYSPAVFFEWDKTYLEENGEDPLSGFRLLKKLGYSSAILFDHVGELLLEIRTDDMEGLRHCMDCIAGEKLEDDNRRINYYDVLCFPDGSGLTNREFILRWFLNVHEHTGGGDEDLKLKAETLESRYAALETQFRKTDNALRETQDWLRQRDEALAETDEALKKTQGWLKERDEALAETDRKYQLTDEALKKTQDWLRERDGALKEADAALAEKEEAYRQAETMLHESQDRLFLAEKQLKEKCDEYDKVVSSLSWKLTKPFRRLSGREKK